MITKIVIDSREQERLNQIKEYLKVMKFEYIEVKQSQLEFGDYALYSNEKEILRVEYKQVNDFLGSITDGRLTKQSVNLTQYPNPMFIITGNIYESMNELIDIDWNINYVLGAMSSIIAKGNSLIYAPDFRAALYIMVKTAEKIVKNRNGFVRFNYIEKTQNAAFDYLCLMPLIGEKIAAKIVKILKINTLKDLLEVTKEQLLSVDKVGETKANSIIKNLRGND